MTLCHYDIMTRCHCHHCTRQFITIPSFISQENCSCLDNAAILFINTNLLLEYRANWRFLFSTETHGRSLEEMAGRICYRGPTILVVKDTEGRMFGAHASTSWCNTEGGWVGNGEFIIVEHSHCSLVEICRDTVF